MNEKTAYRPERALELLRLGCGNSAAQFRDGQEEAIRCATSGGRLLVVQKTGWGKSFIYFIAAKLFRESGGGPAILISPLLALMRNQIEAAERMGIRAVTINSSNTENWEEIITAVAERDEVDILLISPERLANEVFKAQVLDRVAGRVSLLVIDEAHCISDWGHDFRPRYRLIERLARDLPVNIPLIATTATANRRVMDDIRDILGPDLQVLRGDLARPSLVLQTLPPMSQAKRLAWLAQALGQIKGSGIVYALTVRDAETVARWLCHRGFDVAAYTSESGEKERPDLERRLLENQIKALVATTALGMGYDKPDLAFVIHYQAPGSVVAYYQQVGRAGRALSAAHGILMSGKEELDIQNFFIRSAFPRKEEVQDVLDALEDSEDGLSKLQLQEKVNISQGRIEKTLLLLSLESPAPIVKNGATWQLTPQSLSPAFWERAERLTRLRKEEQKQMQDYACLAAGHMDFLIQALDGEPASGATAAGTPLHIEPDPDIVNDAVKFLRGGAHVIEPRRRWPTGAIRQEEQNEEGRTLCIWGDDGWGKLVRQGKHEGNRYDDQLVIACADLVQRWGAQPAWVTSIPSLRHPELTPDFARRLAGKLNLPAFDVVRSTELRPAQKEMQNSVQQAGNVDGAFAVDDVVPEGPVLLVDDIVDSRWTLTVVGRLLRLRGSGPVLPLALAWAGNRG